MPQSECLKNGLKCTEMCSLSNCGNWHAEEDDINEGNLEDLLNDLSDDEDADDD